MKRKKSESEWNVSFQKEGRGMGGKANLGK